jgi:hypothetical protein
MEAQSLVPLALMFLRLAAMPAAAQSAGAGAGQKICGWFTPAEIGGYLGVEVEHGRVGGPLDSLCQWVGKADPGQTFLQIQIASRRSWAVPDLAKGFARLRGIGEDAYIAEEFHGWVAGAKTATTVVVVKGVGGTITRDKTVELLRAAAAHQ